MKLNDNAEVESDPRLFAIPDIHGHAKGEHKAFAEERPIPLSARMLFLWFFHACRRGWPRFMMVTDHMNYLTFEDPAAVNLVRRALKLAQAGDLYGAAETASVEVGHAAVVSEGLRRGMRYSIGAEVDNDPRSRPDAQNIVDAMKPDGMIRSVHFLQIDHPTHGPGWHWPFDNPEFRDVYDLVGTEKTWEIYMTTLLDAIERLPGNIVGHFYVPALFGHWPDDATLEKYEDQLVDACEARGMAVEFNTRFLYRERPQAEVDKYLAAHARLLKKCKAKNVGIAVGSDAHSPKDQGRGFETVLRVLDECEINEIVFPISGRLAHVALRVERKPEPEPPSPPAEAVPDEKKPVRKARTSETSGRPKETSPKRDETAPDDEPSSEGTDRQPMQAKTAKSRVKHAAPEPEVEDAVPAEAEVATAPPQEAAPVAEMPQPEPAPPEPAQPEPVQPEPVQPELPEPDLPEPDLPEEPVSPASTPQATVASAKAVHPPRRAPAVAPKAKPQKGAARPVTAHKVAAKAKPAAKKAERPAAKKAAPLKAAAKKTAAKQSGTKKTSTQAAPAAKKAALKRVVAKKAPAKKAPAKKSTAKKPASKRR